MNYSGIKVNPQRFRMDFEDLSKIGATSLGGVDRPAFSEAHQAARAWFREKIHQSGLELFIDGAGNHSGILHSNNPKSKTLLLGSHLDSVPNGGRYDGALGVLAALEVLRTIKESGINLPVNLEAIDFTDEEGALLGDFGSAALAGSLSEMELSRIDGGYERVTAALSLFDRKPEDLTSAKRDTDSLYGYLELHIEQGSKLKQKKKEIGVVTGIVGVGTCQISFVGRPDHAGTTAMQERRDAAQGAAAYILSVHKTVIRDFPESVANVVWRKTLPGGLNIVSERAELGLEFRSPDTDRLLELNQTLITIAERTAQQANLGVEIKPLSFHTPVHTSLYVQDLIRSNAHQMGYKTLDIVSGAWHDAQMLAPICPTGMIFIPSENGSHSPCESAEWDDCIRGANVLLQTTLQMGFAADTQ